jgi:hypothetical protein
MWFSKSPNKREVKGLNAGNSLMRRLTPYWLSGPIELDPTLNSRGSSVTSPQLGEPAFVVLRTDPAAYTGLT